MSLFIQSTPQTVYLNGAFLKKLLSCCARGQKLPQTPNTPFSFSRLSFIQNGTVAVWGSFVSIQHLVASLLLRFTTIRHELALGFCLLLKQPGLMDRMDTQQQNLTFLAKFCGEGFLPLACTRSNLDSSITTHKKQGGILIN